MTIPRFEGEGMKARQLDRSAEDLYFYLGIQRDASADEIKRAYRKKAVEFHPDKHQDEDAKKENEIKLQNCVNAYAVLSDASERKKYDAARDSFLKSCRDPATRVFSTSSTPDLPNMHRLTPGTTFDTILSEYKDVIKDIHGELKPDQMKAKGYGDNVGSEQYKNGVLVLTFPNKKEADEFIERLIKKGYIVAPAPQLGLERPAALEPPAPVPAIMPPRPGKG